LLNTKPWSVTSVDASQPTNGPPSSQQLPDRSRWNLRVIGKPTTLPTTFVAPSLREKTGLGRRLNQRVPLVVPTHVGWNKVFDAPQGLVDMYGHAALSTAQRLDWDFPLSRVEHAKGQVLAYGHGGVAQASLDFTFRWASASETPFEITACTSHRAKFVALGSVADFVPLPDAVEFLHSFVVLGLYAVDSDADGCSSVQLDAVSQHEFAKACGNM
jgi:hypothetical protein